MATINYNSGNINVSMFPTNVNPIWFCDKNTGGINIATNGAAIAANTIQVGNVNTTTNVSGTLKTNAITTLATTSALNIGGDQTSGDINIGLYSGRTGYINIGNNMGGGAIQLGNNQSAATAINIGSTVGTNTLYGRTNMNGTTKLAGGWLSTDTTYTNCFGTQSPMSWSNYALYQNNVGTIIQTVGYTSFQTSGTERMRLTSDGYLGIGTTGPGYPLEVGFGNNFNAGQDSTYWQKDVALSRQYGSEVVSCSIKASAAIVTLTRYIAVSDRRIKTTILDVEDDVSLVLFRKLQPKTYEYIDKIMKGYDTVYGFIAQEVKEVLPNAVNIITETIPNVFDLTPVSGDKLTFDTSKLEYDASGQLFKKIKLIKKDNTEFFVNILSVEGNMVRIDQTLEGDKVFVYGQEVNNFHTLNKDAIWTVATAALQEVDRQLQAEKAKTALLQQNYEQLLARIVALESKA